MHAACHAEWVAQGGVGCIRNCGGQLCQYAPPPRPPESEIEVCSDGDGAPDDESTEGGAEKGREDRGDGSYAGEGTDDEAYDDVTKPAATRKRKANGKGSGGEAKRARAQTPKGGKCAHGRERYTCKECGRRHMRPCARRGYQGWLTDAAALGAAVYNGDQGPSSALIEAQ
jgi:hypothetical protein